jgi:hypothetical protein
VMSRSWCRALGTATSHSRLPASPAPLACAQGLARAGLPIGPTQGGIFISGVPPRLTVSHGPTLRTSLPAPLGRGVGNQYLRRRRRRSLLRSCGHSRVTRRLARRNRACCCPRRPR